MRPARATQCYGQAVSTKAVFKQIRILTDDPHSCTIMNEIHPSLQGASLPPQLLHREPERFRRSFMIRYPLFSSRSREQRLVKIFRQVLSIFIHHRPHRPDHAPEPAVLYRSRKVESFIDDASFSHLSCVTSREKCEFGGGQIRAHDLE